MTIAWHNELGLIESNWTQSLHWPRSCSAIKLNQTHHNTLPTEHIQTKQILDWSNLFLGLCIGNHSISNRVLHISSKLCVGFNFKQEFLGEKQDKCRSNWQSTKWLLKSTLSTLSLSVWTQKVTFWESKGQIEVLWRYFMKKAPGQLGHLQCEYPGSLLQRQFHLLYCW